MGPTDCLAPWIDRPYHLLSSQLPLGRCDEPTKLDVIDFDTVGPNAKSFRI
jgi:hypothetical protein